MTDRDTHFKITAEQLARELKERDFLNVGNSMIPLLTPPVDYDYEAIKRIITLFLYDFAYHVIGENMGGSSSAIHFYVNGTPDLTTWPDVTQDLHKTTSTEL